MLEFTKYLKTIFLNKETMKELIDLGMNTDDAQYVICQVDDKEYIVAKTDCSFENCIPTYSLGDLLCKLDEYPYITINNSEYGGPIMFFKDAPFYGFGYNLKNKYGDIKHILPCDNLPLYGAANLLKWCLENNMWYVKNISDIVDRIK